MLIKKDPVGLDDDDGDAKPTRFWRRPGIIVIAVVVLGIVGYAASRSKEEPKHATNQGHHGDVIGEFVAYVPPAPLVKPATAQGNKDPKPVPDEALPTPPQPPPPPAAPAAPAPPVQPPVQPQAPRIWPPVTGGQQEKQNVRTMVVYAQPPKTAPAAAPPPPDETSIGFKTMNIPGLKASPAIDDTYLLMPGLLPLVLDTAINSDSPGKFLAHLPGPVYSKKGVLLMEANSQVIGTYSNMGKGSRLSAVSTIGWTPNGVWVPLTDQGMTDDLGRAGLDGEINRHLLQRFGPAVLLSLTGQALSIIQAEASKGGNTYLNLGSGGGGGGGVEGLASQILQSQINIPDTFSKHQGETIALFLDRPVDFSAAYHISLVKAPK